ncbi:MAG: biotin--[acetyl-CoA-carboxylase] ligase [Chloroflexota bacterium]|nr:MAG: biotin--[acetyl-CoA-carboxylase] ligase [Chloroflexota bacterium]
MTNDNLFSTTISSSLKTLFIGRDLRYFDSVTSTNEVARELARAGIPEGATILANHQDAGRGRMGRTWVAPPGSSLLVSIVLRPALAEVNSLIMAAALATTRAIESATPLRASIKWPNDVEIDGKKVGGILVESEIERGQLLFAVLGTGLNVNFNPHEHADIPPTATSLSNEVGHPIGRVTLLRAYLEALEHYCLASRGGAPVWQEWRDRLETLGKWVRLTSGDSVTEGWAEDVDSSGTLYIRQSNGQITKARAGEVTLRLAQPPG